MTKVVNAKSPLRVAIVGASGIGKNHAAWFQKNGAEICAFAGSSNESLQATKGVLEAKLGYAPNGYISLSQLFQSEKPDAVCIASPPHLHFEHTAFCIENGVHTLCEKPLVYDSKLASAELVSQAQQLCELAAIKGVLLATQMQYYFLADAICELANISPSDIETIEMEMETKNLKPGRSHETIWIELAPHPLSVLQRLFPTTNLDTDSIDCRIGEMETTAQFQLQRENGSKIDVRVITRCNPETSTPRRCFTINGTTTQCASRQNEDGNFLTFLSNSDTEIVMPDLVDLLVGNFLAACESKEQLVVTGVDGARNVEWLLKILDQGNRLSM